MVRRIRRCRRKSVLDLSLVTVEMAPAGFGLMLDVSEDGLGVQVRNKIEPGTEVQVKFDVPPTSTRVEASGVVTWYDGEGRVGLSFRNIENGATQTLRQWIETLPEAHKDEVKAVAAPMPHSTQHPGLVDQVRAIQRQIASSKLNVDLVLQFLIERVGELTESTGGAIALGASQEMVCRASTGLAPDVGVKIGSDSALTAECLRTGKTIRCDDAATDLRVDREICRRLNLRSLLILPILFQGEVRGVLELFSAVPHAFGEQHLAMLRQLAEFTAQVVYAPSEASAKTPPPQPEAARLMLAPTAERKETAEAPTAVSGAVEIQGLQAVTQTASLPAAPSAVSPAQNPAPWLAAPESTAPIQPGNDEAAAALPVPPEIQTSQQPLARKTVVSTDEMFPGIEPVRDPGYRKVLLPLAALFFLLVILGYWFKARISPSPKSSVAVVHRGETLPNVPPVSSQSAPAVTDALTPETMAPPASPGKSLPATQKAKSAQRQNLEDLVKDSVRSAPITVAPGTASLKPKEEASANAPAVQAPGDLSALHLPEVLEKPELKPQHPGTTGGYPVHQVQPIYPPSAREKRVEGDVVLAVRVLKNGMVGNVRRVSGSPLLAVAAADAVRRWRYRPYEVNGEAQNLETTVTVQFRLPQ
jgi:protein TonB